MDPPLLSRAPFTAKRNPRTGSVVGRPGTLVQEKHMPVASTSLVERIARVIAGRVLSSNADGEDRSAGEKVDEVWRYYTDDAVSILKTMREPDAAAAGAGDVAVWERMIEASLAANGG
jgi:hypothetical protein